MPDSDRARGLRRRIRALNSLRIVFSLLGVGLIVFGLFRMRESSRVRGWMSTTGKVIESTINEFAGKDGRTYRPMVVYSYSVGSVRFMSSRIALHPLASPDRDHVARIARTYPTGKDVQVLYDPTNPEQAVLEPGSGPWLPIVAGGIFSMLAVGVRILRGRTEQGRARN